MHTRTKTIVHIKIYSYNFKSNETGEYNRYEKYYEINQCCDSSILPHEADLGSILLMSDQRMRRAKGMPYMDQITIKTSNPKCRFFLKIYL
jgi:hypothetical protein